MPSFPKKLKPVAFKFKGMAFFDRSIIKTNWKAINENPLKKAGLLVRKVARQSIRRAKKGGKSGPAGSPPRSRLAGSTPPFKMIYSVPEGFTRVVVGMVGFASKGTPVPGLQEHGGTASRWVFEKKQDKGDRNRKGHFKKARNKRVKKSVRYPKRPFMEPALEKTQDKLPGLWSGSLGE